MAQRTDFTLTWSSIFETKLQNLKKNLRSQLKFHPNKKKFPLEVNDVSVFVLIVWDCDITYTRSSERMNSKDFTRYLLLVPAIIRHWNLFTFRTNNIESRNAKCFVCKQMRRQFSLIHSYLWVNIDWFIQMLFAIYFG